MNNKQTVGKSLCKSKREPSYRHYSTLYWYASFLRREDFIRGTLDSRAPARVSRPTRHPRPRQGWPASQGQPCPAHCNGPFADGALAPAFALYCKSKTVAFSRCFTLKVRVWFFILGAVFVRKRQLSRTGIEQRKAGRVKKQFRGLTRREQWI